MGNVTLHIVTGDNDVPADSIWLQNYIYYQVYKNIFRIKSDDSYLF